MLVLGLHRCSVGLSFVMYFDTDCTGHQSSCSWFINTACFVDIQHPKWLSRDFPSFVARNMHRSCCNGYLQSVSVEVMPVMGCSLAGHSWAEKETTSENWLRLICFWHIQSQHSCMDWRGKSDSLIGSHPLNDDNCEAEIALVVTWHHSFTEWWGNIKHQEHPQCWTLWISLNKFHTSIIIWTRTAGEVPHISTPEIMSIWLTSQSWVMLGILGGNRHTQFWSRTMALPKNFWNLPGTGFQVL